MVSFRSEVWRLRMEELAEGQVVDLRVSQRLAGAGSGPELEKFRLRAEHQGAVGRGKLHTFV